MKHGKRIGLFLLAVFVLYQPMAWGQLLEENFDYPAGANLSDHGWTIDRGSDHKILIGTPGLEYTDYGLSGIGNAALLAPAPPMTDGEEVFKTFSEQSSGTVYLSFLVNISAVNPDNSEGGLILYMGPTDVTIFNRIISLYFSHDTAGNLAFGVSKVGGFQLSDFSYAMNTTYLIVLAYTFNPATTNDDMASLWVDPPLTGQPPAPVATSSDGDDVTSIGGIMLSRIDEYTPTASVDGIRITTDWNFGTTSVTETTLPRIVELHQNYPNPFNPSTSISYTLPQRAEVALSVFDVLGHEILTLVEGMKGAGRHDIRFDASQRPSGFYFYRLEVDGSIIDTRRMVLMK